jgi:hypothetical protein
MSRLASFLSINSKSHSPIISLHPSRFKTVSSKTPICIFKKEQDATRELRKGGIVSSGRRIPLGWLAPAHPGAIARAGPRRRRRSPRRQEAVLLAEMVEDAGRGWRRSRPTVLVTGVGRSGAPRVGSARERAAPTARAPPGKRRRMPREEEAALRPAAP